MLNRRSFLLGAAGAFTLSHPHVARAATPSLVNVASRQLFVTTEEGANEMALYPAVMRHPDGGLWAIWTQSWSSDFRAAVQRFGVDLVPRSTIRAIGKPVDPFPGTVATMGKTGGMLATSTGEIAVRPITPDGAPTRKPIVLATRPNNGNQWLAKIAGLPNGNFVVAWSAFGVERGNATIKARIVRPDGRPVSSTLIMAGGPGTLDADTTTMITSLDSVLVAGLENDDIGVTKFVRRLSSSGQRGAKIIVARSTDRARATWDLGMTDLGDGRFAAFWTEGDSLRGAVYGHDGIRRHGFQTVASRSLETMPTLPVVNLLNGTIMVMCGDGTAFIYRTGTGRLVAGPLPMPISYASPQSAVRLPGGGIAVASMDFIGPRSCIDCLAFA